MRRTIGTKEEFRIAAPNRLLKSITIFRFFSKWFTVVMRLWRHGIDGEMEMMSCDGTSYGRRQGFDALDGFGRGSVFQYNP